MTFHKQDKSAFHMFVCLYRSFSTDFIQCSQNLGYMDLVVLEIIYIMHFSHGSCSPGLQAAEDFVYASSALSGDGLSYDWQNMSSWHSINESDTMVADQWEWTATGVND